MKKDFNRGLIEGPVMFVIALVAIVIWRNTGAAIPWWGVALISLPLVVAVLNALPKAKGNYESILESMWGSIRTIGSAGDLAVRLLVGVILLVVLPCFVAMMWSVFLPREITVYGPDSYETNYFFGGNSVVDNRSHYSLDLRVNRYSSVIAFGTPMESVQVIAPGERAEVLHDPDYILQPAPGAVSSKSETVERYSLEMLKI